MHRVAWDLRYPTPPSLPFGYTGTLLDYTEFTLNWHSIPGNTPSLQPVGPLVVPGDYTVTLMAGGTKVSRRVTVVPDPRVGVPQSALVAQLALMQRMIAGLAASNEGFTELARLRAAVAELNGKNLAAGAAAAARSFDSTLAVLATGPRGFGPSNRDLARRLTDMEYGDAQPTASVIEAAETNCRDITAALTRVKELESGPGAALNGILRAARVAEVPLWSVQTRGC
jgi:hypothetical protein